MAFKDPSLGHSLMACGPLHIYLAPTSGHICFLLLLVVRPTIDRLAFHHHPWQWLFPPVLDGCFGCDLVQARRVQSLIAENSYRPLSL